MSGQTAVDLNDESASGGVAAYIGETAGDYIEFYNVPKANELVIRYASYGDQSVRLYINGEAAVDIELEDTGWIWAFYAEKTINIHVPEGAAIRLEKVADGWGPSIDFIKIR
jgi:hypothetical protein